jgi:hypothetical protein
MSRLAGGLFGSRTGTTSSLVRPEATDASFLPETATTVVVRKEN